MSAEYSCNVCMCLFKKVPVDCFYFMGNKPVWKVRQAITVSSPRTRTIADLGAHPPSLPSSDEGAERRSPVTCSLHSCPQWGGQEMPASSQEGLLRWDFPIYFLNARRPDTGGDKRSRLQVLIICQAPGPHSHGQLLLETCRPKFSLVPNREVSPTENHDHLPLSFLARKPLQIPCWTLTRRGIFCLGYS